ncbi:MAG TPA: hypothetical protein VE693_07955 [Gaiellaceae bacterium]|nr:hypothetical protein [Gaiellaceae bacterium]
MVQSNRTAAVVWSGTLTLGGAGAGGATTGGQEVTRGGGGYGYGSG